MFFVKKKVQVKWAIVYIPVCSKVLYKFKRINGVKLIDI